MKNPTAEQACDKLFTIEAARINAGQPATQWLAKICMRLYEHQASCIETYFLFKAYELFLRNQLWITDDKFLQYYSSTYRVVKKSIPA